MSPAHTILYSSCYLDFVCASRAAGTKKGAVHAVACGRLHILLGTVISFLTATVRFGNAPLIALALALAIPYPPLSHLFLYNSVLQVRVLLFADKT